MRSGLYADLAASGLRIPQETTSLGDSDVYGAHRVVPPEPLPLVSRLYTVVLRDFAAARRS